MCFPVISSAYLIHIQVTEQIRAHLCANNALFTSTLLQLFEVFTFRFGENDVIWTINTYLYFKEAQVLLLIGAAL